MAWRAPLHALIVVLVAITACTRPAGPGADVRRVTLVGVSDWHGQLEPISIIVDGPPRPAGGAAALKAYFDRERARNPEGTLVIMAGDSFGATPPVSAFLEDVPAVEVQNALGVGADTLGNHNFDHGLTRLRNLLGLARFPYLSANVVAPDGSTLVPPGQIVVLNGVRVGLVGVTNPDVPTLIGPGRAGDYRFLDPAPAANAQAARLRHEGAHVVVVLAHLGATAVAPDGTPLGRLGELARALRGVEVLVGDHTDVTVNAQVGDVLVVQSRSKGVQYHVIDVDVDVGRRAVTRKSAAHRRPWADAITPDAALHAQLEGYRAQVQPLFDHKVGETAVVVRRAGPLESPLGSAVADALRAAYGTQLAFVNSGGVRDDLPSSYRPADFALRRPIAGYRSGPPWDVVAGDVHAVLPFGNVAVTFQLTGRTLWQALEHSVAAGTMVGGGFAGEDGRFLQISGFRFRFDPRQPSGRRVVEVMLTNGTPIAVNDREYTAATVDFVYAGGDGYRMLDNRTGVTRMPVTDTMREAIAQTSPVGPPAGGRIAIVRD